MKWNSIFKYDEYQKCVKCKNNQVRNLLMNLCRFNLIKKKKNGKYTKNKNLDFSLKIFRNKLEASNTNDINFILKENDLVKLELLRMNFCFN